MSFPAKGQTALPQGDPEFPPGWGGRGSEQPPLPPSAKPLPKQPEQIPSPVMPAMGYTEMLARQGEGAQVGIGELGLPPIARWTPPQLRAPTPEEIRKQMGGSRLEAARAEAQRAYQPPPGYARPQFLERPEGEAEIEDFAFRQMVAMGEHAPEALQNQWMAIQGAKRDRIAKRADYHANLIRARHAADLNLRNQGFADDSRGYLEMARNLTDLRLKEAEMIAQSRRDAADAANQLRGQVRDAMIAMNQAPAGPDPKMLRFVHEKHVPHMIKAFATTRSAMNVFRKFLPDVEWSGIGSVSELRQYLAKNVGMRDSVEFGLALNKMRADIITAHAETAGARGVDSEGEAKRLMGQIPSAGADYQTIADWMYRFVNEQYGLISKRAQLVEDVAPGYGRKVLRDFMSTEDLKSAAAILDTAGRMKGQ